MEIDNEAQIRGRYWNMKKSRFAKKMMALILAVVTAVTLMPVNGFMSKVSADETENVKPNYLTFTAGAPNSSVTLKYLNLYQPEYSKDNGTTWNEYKEGTCIELNEDESVCFRGKNVQTGTRKHFEMTGEIYASGSVTSLTDGVGNNPNIEFGNSFYKSMFEGCNSLVTAPELPATRLTNEDCYSGMFKNCKNLRTAPQLPATQLVKGCYYSMFNGCISLVEAP